MQNSMEIDFFLEIHFSTKRPAGWGGRRRAVCLGGFLLFCLRRSFQCSSLGVYWPSSVQPHVLREPEHLGPRKNVLFAVVNRLAQLACAPSMLPRRAPRAPIALRRARVATLALAQACRSLVLSFSVFAADSHHCTFPHVEDFSASLPPPASAQAWSRVAQCSAHRLSDTRRSEEGRS